MSAAQGLRWRRANAALRTIIAGIDKLPTYQGRVFRGISVSPCELDGVLARYEPGITVREPAFTTTSPTAPTAPYEVNVEFVINSTQGKDLSCLREPEVLYPPDHGFTIVDRNFDPTSGKWKIYLSD